MERLVALFCKACAGALGFISRDGDGVLSVENRERQAAPPGEPRPIRYYDPFVIRDPRQMLREGRPRNYRIAPLSCPKCERKSVLEAGGAADALNRYQETGRKEKLTIVPMPSPKPRTLERVDWTE